MCYEKVNCRCVEKPGESRDKEKKDKQAKIRENSIKGQVVNFSKHSEMKTGM